MSAVGEDDKLSPAETRAVLRRAAALGRPYRNMVLLTFVFVTMSTSAAVLGPVLLRYGIDHGIRAGNRTALNIAIVAFLVVGVVAYVGARAQFITINRAGEGFLRILRLRVFAHLQKQSLAFYDRNQAGVLVSRMTADIESMAELVQWGLLQFMAAAVLVVFALITLFAMSWQLTLAALVVVPIVLLGALKFQRDSNAAYLVVRDHIGKNMAALQENFAGVRVIQAYGREPEQYRRFKENNRALYRSHIHSVRVSAWFFGLVEASGVAATAAAIGVGAWQVQAGNMSIGTVIAVVLLLSSLFEPVQQISQIYNTVQSASASLNKLFTILDTEPEVTEAGDAVELPANGPLIVDAMTFGYPGTERSVLHNISLSVAVGERLALVGPTGAGKSSLAKLMARLYDPNDGTVSFGGVDLRQATQRSLRDRIVVVPQEGFIFNGTVADNLRLAKPSATPQELRDALDAIGVLDRFTSLPDGLDTDVRERGSRLSAGERQLLALARAALVDPAVLVLDEATSSLDPGTEALVEHALDTLMEGRTVLVVAHRLTTVERADRIAVIAEGHLAELGNHAELTAQGGRYASLSAAWKRTQ